MRRRVWMSVILWLLLLSCLISSCASTQLQVMPDKELTIPAGDYVIIKKRVLADLLESCRQCASERNECLDKLRTK